MSAFSKIEEINKDMGPGLMLDNNLMPGTVIASTTLNSNENNYHGQDPEPAFSDDEEEIPLR
ncbi:hypothetical protein G9C98_002736 [Cotesia typhae]|uniref:Uncharacterized protein n=1 Tax=Cotesia typhae TaxID=2053667 RepID=A0A8J5QVG1_9HYME|nr:hypothetical protein G9C98_002736 [Cotesia typhae]